eukprot:scaffold70006_cov31-Tisochrysis_lutea.AAC.1
MRSGPSTTTAARSTPHAHVASCGSTVAHLLPLLAGATDAAASLHGGRSVRRASAVHKLDSHAVAERGERCSAVGRSAKHIECTRAGCSEPSIPSPARCALSTLTSLP